MYDRNFAMSCVESIRNGVMIKTTSEKTGVSKCTLHQWLNGNLPHERLFSTRKEYQQNYYRTHKLQYRLSGFRYRFGSDVGIAILVRDKHRCVSCGKDKHLVIHHIDEDVTNIDPSNLQLRTNRGHTKWHKIIKKLIDKQKTQ